MPSLVVRGAIGLCNSDEIFDWASMVWTDHYVECSGLKDIPDLASRLKKI